MCSKRKYTKTYSLLTFIPTQSTHTDITCYKYNKEYRTFEISHVSHKHISYHIPILCARMHHTPLNGSHYWKTQRITRAVIGCNHPVFTLNPSKRHHVFPCSIYKNFIYSKNARAIWLSIFCYVIITNFDIIIMTMMMIM